MSGIIGHLAFSANRSGVRGIIPGFQSYGTNYTGGTSLTKIVEAGFYYNYGSCQSSGRFTCPLPGVYQFDFWGLIYVVGEGQVGAFKYIVNGDNSNIPPSSQAVQSGTTAGSHFERSGTFSKNFNTGDYVELHAGLPAGQAYVNQWHMSGKMLYSI